jgi:YHYH protein
MIYFRMPMLLVVTAMILLGFRILGATTSAQNWRSRSDILDIHHLLLGDGKISASPRSGYVMSCMSAFPGGGRRGGPGAQVVGRWIHGDTWDVTQKISVQGRVTWPRATFQITSEGADRIVSRVIQGNGLPVDTLTGKFPVAYDDPAFQIDRNPNSIEPQQIVLKLPANPEMAAAPSCVPMGMIGLALNGVAIYNALDEGGRDAVAHEVQDICNGHPQMSGQYHYHGPSACLPNQTANETLIGYANDGFGIFSMYDAQGRELADADLDECHGRTSEVLWDGARFKMYHYVLTREYPYAVGCFRGTPVRAPGGDGRGRRGPGPPGGRRGGTLF